MARVLLVDDDAGVLDTCGAILRHAGLDVETASSGHAALGVLARLSCDLLLLDLRLPDISGFGILAEARRRGSPAPAVLITGHPTLETSLEAMRLGVVDYLVKPVFEDSLVAAAARALNRCAQSGLSTPPGRETTVGHPRPSEHQGPSNTREQIHLRLLPEDAALLRQVARERGQTLSGAIRFLLKPFRSHAR